MLGHEIAHVANGDMVTMTLVQGVVNAFVMFLARVLAFFVAQLFRPRRRRGAASPTSSTSWRRSSSTSSSRFLGSVVVAWFSRFREFRADAGGARLAGRGADDRRARGAPADLRHRRPGLQPGRRPDAQDLRPPDGASCASSRRTRPLETRIARLKMSA